MFTVVTHSKQAKCVTHCPDFFTSPETIPQLAVHPSFPLIFKLGHFEKIIKYYYYFNFFTISSPK